MKSVVRNFDRLSLTIRETISRLAGVILAARSINQVALAALSERGLQLNGDFLPSWVDRSRGTDESGHWGITFSCKC
jgi:hypothetical protein